MKKKKSEINFPEHEICYILSFKNIILKRAFRNTYTTFEKIFYVQKLLNQPTYLFLAFIFLQRVQQR